jgi:HD-like signal output (HDOD) protein
MAALKDAKAKQKPGLDSQQPIENSVLAVLELPKGIEVPPLFLEFSDKILPRLALPATGRSILEAFSNIDVTADKLAACLKHNPYYEYQFLQVIQSLGKREDMPSLEAAVVLLGMQNSRNLILALQAIRMTKGTHPAWGEDGKLQLVPAEILEFALKIEDLLSKDKGGYADTAYAAGFVFDLLVLLSQGAETDEKISAAYIESVFSHGLKAAKIAAEIGKTIPDFVLKKYIFSACLIHDVGKAAMTILSGEYPKFVE